MTTTTSMIEALANREYKYGFVTEIEADSAPRGLNEDIIHLISAKKNEPEWMLEWGLKAYRHWATLEQLNKEPKWANIHYGPIDYQDIVYYSAPKPKGNSPDEIDPELLATFEKLGIPLEERMRLAGVAVDAVFDSVYACVITSLPDGGNKVEIQMTLTAPGCGMGAALKAEVERRVLTVPGVKGVNVELVWDPIWDPSMMSEAARLQLGLM